MQGKPFHYRAVFAFVFSFDFRQQVYFASIQFVGNNMGVLGFQVNPYLVQAACNLLTLKQREMPEQRYGFEKSSRWFPCLFVYSYPAGMVGIDRQIHQMIFKTNLPFNYSMVDFFYLPVFKLNAHVAVRFGVERNDYCTTGFPIQPVAKCGIRVEFPGQFNQRNTGELATFVQRWDIRRLINDKVIVVLVKDPGFKCGRVGFHSLRMLNRMRVSTFLVCCAKSPSIIHL